MDMDADSPVDIGREDEEIHVLSIHLVWSAWVHFLRQRWGTGRQNNHDICTECYGELGAGDYNKRKII